MDYESKVLDILEIIDNYVNFDYLNTQPVIKQQMIDDVKAYLESAQWQ